MGRLIIDGNKVYTVDENCMRKKNLTYTQIRQQKRNETEQKRQPTKRN